jgi:arylsulfatase A-like enzyme
LAQGSRIRRKGSHEDSASRIERGRRLLAAALLLAAAVVLAGCYRTVTHESGAESPERESYDRVDSEGGAFYLTADEQFAGVTPYEGQRTGWVTTAGDLAAEERAAGVLEVERPYKEEGVYSAAFYFPQGTFSGSSPSQNGEVYVMRWDNERSHPEDANFGGIRLGSDHRAELVKGKGSQVTPIGKRFTLREGCWNMISVRQKIATSADAGDAENEVFLNGERVVSANGTANIDDARGVDDVKFGYLASDPAQDRQLYYYIDNAAVGAGGASITAPQRPVCEPLPNVLFIITDDQRTDSVIDDPDDGRPNPLPYAVMPNVRKWFHDGASGIEGGTEFTRAYATTPLCCPARASILSGRYAHNHNVKQNERAYTNFDQDPTIQRYLSDSGYRNAAFGKFLMQWVAPPTGQTVKRVAHFDEYGLLEGSYVNPVVRENGSSGDVFRTATGYSTTYVREKGKSFVTAQDQKEDGRPWFMYLAPYAPHEFGLRNGLTAWDPMTVGSELASGFTPPPFTPAPNQYEDDVSDKPAWLRNWADIGTQPNPASGSNNNGQRRIFEKTVNGVRYPGLREQQLRTLRDVDLLVDQLMTTLEAQGEADDTIAFFISDNGYDWRERGQPGLDSLPSECRADGPNGTLSGAAMPCGHSAKSVPYTESISVPLFMRWPNDPRVGQSATRSDLVANIDLAPTVLDAIGEEDAPPAPTPMDGRSLLGGAARSALLTEYWPITPNARIGTWASLVYPGHQYIGWYPSEDPLAQPTTWEEWYELPGDGQRTNLYPDGHYLNDADPGEPAPPANMTELRSCSGTACP